MADSIVKGQVYNPMSSGRGLKSHELDSNAHKTLFDEVLSRLESPFTYKGVVSSTSDLPSSGNILNDAYYVERSGCLYSWNGSEWGQSSLPINEILEARWTVVTEETNKVIEGYAQNDSLIVRAVRFKSGSTIIKAGVEVSTNGVDWEYIDIVPAASLSKVNSVSVSYVDTRSLSIGYYGFVFSASSHNSTDGISVYNSTNGLSWSLLGTFANAGIVKEVSYNAGRFVFLICSNSYASSPHYECNEVVSIYYTTADGFSTAYSHQVSSGFLDSIFFAQPFSDYVFMLWSRATSTFSATRVCTFNVTDGTFAEFVEVERATTSLREIVNSMYYRKYRNTSPYTVVRYVSHISSKRFEIIIDNESGVPTFSFTEITSNFPASVYYYRYFEDKDKGYAFRQNAIYEVDEANETFTSLSVPSVYTGGNTYITPDACSLNSGDTLICGYSNTGSSVYKSRSLVYFFRLEVESQLNKLIEEKVKEHNEDESAHSEQFVALNQTKANINSPTFTGTPKATNTPSENNDKALATVDFVKNYAGQHQEIDPYFQTTNKAADAKSTGGLIATVHSTDREWKEGEYCIYNGKLYVAKVDVPVGELWTSSHWVEVKLAGEVYSLYHALGFDSSKKPIFIYNSVKGVVASNGNWATGSEKYRHIAISVSPGDDIKIISNPLYRTPIAFLRTYNIPLVQEERPDYSEEEGYDHRISTVLSTVNHYIVPSDVHYLIVDVLYNDVDYSPSSLKINGYDIAKSISSTLLETFNVLAEEYNESSIYKVGDYRRRGAVLYRCVVDINVAESWNPQHWEEVLVMKEVEKSLRFLGILSIIEGVTPDTIPPIPGYYAATAAVTREYVDRNVDSIFIEFTNMLGGHACQMFILPDGRIYVRRSNTGDFENTLEEEYGTGIKALEQSRMLGVEIKVPLDTVQVEEHSYWDGESFVESQFYGAYKYNVEGIDLVKVSGIQPGSKALLARFYDENDIEISNTRYSVEISQGEKTEILSVPDDATYMWVNNFLSHADMLTYQLEYDTNPENLIGSIEDDIENISTTKMNGLFEYESVEPSVIEDGKIWRGALVDGYSDYCAYKFLVPEDTNIRIKGVQPSSATLLARFYDSNGVQVGTTIDTVDISAGSKTAKLKTPKGCSYAWVNTLKAYVGSGLEIAVSCDIDPASLTEVVKPIKVEKVESGFYVTFGAFKLYFKLNGNNNIFNLYAGWYNNSVLFVTGTDWFGPYRVEKDGGSSDFEDLFTTGGNHVVTTEGGDVIYTGETVSFSGYCDGEECLDYGVYRAHRFVMAWHNTVLAGNDIKYSGNTPFLDEYYRVEIEPEMTVKVNQYFVPRYDGRLRWYSGLQFAGGSFAPDLYIPAYSRQLVKTSEIAGVTIPDKEVNYIKAVGEVVSLEMELDRGFDLGTNCKLAQVTGNSSKAYFILQNAYGEPLQLNKDSIYSWRGLYRFIKSY